MFHLSDRLHRSRLILKSRLSHGSHPSKKPHRTDRGFAVVNSNPSWLSGCKSLGQVGVGLALAGGLLSAGVAWGHQVQISGTVGGTLHIEPNDTPRANEDTLLWVALTRQGGTAVPLRDCDCTLSIYTSPNPEPLAQPPLRPISAEGYDAIPGANFTFPAVGAYTVVLTGSPQGEADFTPFELSYSVTVAAGSAANSTSAVAVSPDNPASDSSGATWADGDIQAPESNVPNSATDKPPGLGLLEGSLGAIALLGLGLGLWQWRRAASK